MNKMLITSLTVAGALLGAAGTDAAPAVVATDPGGYVVQSAPPPPVYEVTPSARAGLVWAPGHYEWRGDRYVWLQGHWMDNRPGYAWREARWTQQPDGAWILRSGEWVPTDRVSHYRGDAADLAYQRRHPGANGDLDVDGVRNRDDRDRDGDGIMNWRDGYPNDASRS